MSDTLGMDAESAALLDAATEPEQPLDVVYCALKDCPGPVPQSEKGGRQAIYCEDHKGNTAERRRIRRAWNKDHGVTPQDEGPSNVTFQFGNGKPPNKGGKGTASAAELAAVEARAKQLTKGLAILVMMGPPDAARKADAADLLAHGDAFAAATRDLAVYEPWLRKLGAGGEASERGTAWVAFAVATGAMLTPILLRHEVIKGGMANVLQSMLNSDAIDAAA